MANEKLLIDLQNINMNEVDTYDCTDVEDILSAVITYLSEQPIVDAVEVVRCKDCKYRKEPENRFCNPYCTKHLSMQTKDNDFCSCGERKTDG